MIGVKRKGKRRKGKGCATGYLVANMGGLDIHCCCFANSYTKRQNCSWKVRGNEEEIELDNILGISRSFHCNSVSILNSSI